MHKPFAATCHLRTYRLSGLQSGKGYRAEPLRVHKLQTPPGGPLWEQELLASGIACGKLLTYADQQS